MYTAAALLDIHERTHISMRRLLDHLDGLPEAALETPLEGFSYPTLLAQVHHVLAAERYWMGVLEGRIRVDDDLAAHATVASLRALEGEVGEATRALLASLSDEEARSPRRVTKWNGVEMDVAPAHVLLRTQTHAFQHQGEIATMLRQLGHGFPAMLDFPLG